MVIAAGRCVPGRNNAGRTREKKKQLRPTDTAFLIRRVVSTGLCMAMAYQKGLCVPYTKLCMVTVIDVAICTMILFKILRPVVIELVAITS